MAVVVDVSSRWEGVSLVSWTRWSSPCDRTMPQFKVDEECVANGCPGSDIYVWENVGGFKCGCSPNNDAVVFFCETEQEMNAHIVEHHQKGDHVRRSLLVRALGWEPKLTEGWKKFQEEMKSP